MNFSKSLPSCTPNRLQSRMKVDRSLQNAYRRADLRPESNFMSSDTPPLIGFICGSIRKGSINKQLETALVKRFKRAGAETISLNLGTYALPLYNEDLDTPENLGKLVQDIQACDGVVIISPEYNGGLPPLLKNAIDWTSTTGTAHFKAPYWGISACTPGVMSGIMCMRQVNYILTRLGAHVSPVQVGIGSASSAFDAEGELAVDTQKKLADALVQDMLAHI